MLANTKIDRIILTAPRSIEPIETRHLSGTANHNATGPPLMWKIAASLVFLFVTIAAIFTQGPSAYSVWKLCRDMAVQSISVSKATGFGPHDRGLDLDRKNFATTLRLSLGWNQPPIRSVKRIKRTQLEADYSLLFSAEVKLYLNCLFYVFMAGD
jgi:hypothetical protein